MRGLRFVVACQPKLTYFLVGQSHGSYHHTQFRDTVFCYLYEWPKSLLAGQSLVWHHHTILTWSSNICPMFCLASHEEIPWWEEESLGVSQWGWQKLLKCILVFLWKPEFLSGIILKGHSLLLAGHSHLWLSFERLRFFWQSPKSRHRSMCACCFLIVICENAVFHGSCVKFIRAVIMVG